MDLKLVGTTMNLNNCISNDERREVAHKLRDMNFEGSVFLHEKMEMVGDAIGDSFSDILMNDFTNRLADLIEPEPERTCRIEKHAESRGGRWAWVYAFSCGHGFESYWHMNPRYCIVCGAKVMDE